MAGRRGSRRGARSIWGAFGDLLGGLGCRAADRGLPVHRGVLDCRVVGPVSEDLDTLQRYHAHAEQAIRALAIAILRDLQREAPAVFGDYVIAPLPDGSEAATSRYPY
jgi:hypothetical protein